MAYAGDFIHGGWTGDTIYYSFDFVGEWRFNPPYNITDPDGVVRMGTLSARWQTEFEAAMDAWEAVANIHFVETARPDADLFIGWHSFDGKHGTAGDAWGLDRNGDGRFSHANYEGFVVRMDPDDTHVFFKVAVHELGHVLGLGHIEHTPSIMASTVREPVPTAYDIQVIQELYGRSATYPIFGSDGADRLTGTAGADEIHGRYGDDSIDARAGADTLFGNVGADWLDGGDGDDLIFGGQNAGPPRIAGDGSLRRLDGIDTLDGGDGNDTLCGQYGPDFLLGGDGEDALFGGQGDDTLWSGRGNDVLAGNRGDDLLQGGDGNDRYYFGHASGQDTIASIFERQDADNRDLIYIEANVNGSGIRSGEDVLARISDNAQGRAVIDLGAGDSITFRHHDATWFVASDFIIYG